MNLKLVALHLVQAVLRLPAAIFWQAASWRASLATAIENEKGERQ